MKDNAELYENVDRLCLILPQIIKRFHTFPSRPHRTPSVSIPQLRMLFLLETEGDLTMGELARRSSVAMPTATSSINALVGGRYAARRRSRDDRRVVLVSLTAKGTKVLEAFREERRHRLAAIFSNLSAADQLRFVEAFEVILETMAKLDETPPPEDTASQEPRPSP